MFADGLYAEAQKLIKICQQRGIRLATAESCTGGLLAGLLTEIPGSSSVVERGFVTYSNASKSDLLKVPQALIAGHGAVSQEVAHAMAQGALYCSQADIALSVTGIAGPGGGTEQKPVGLVWFSLASRQGGGRTCSEQFSGGRQEVRIQAVKKAISIIKEWVE